MLSCIRLRLLAFAALLLPIASCSLPHQDQFSRTAGYDASRRKAPSLYPQHRRSGLGSADVRASRAHARQPARTGDPKLRPYVVHGVTFTPRHDPNYDRTGEASWYGGSLHGQPTANGETFNENALTAAHRTLALHTWVEVTNLANGRKVVVRINDRGPFVRGRIIDLSRAAARRLGYERAGRAWVRVRYLSYSGRPLSQTGAGRYPTGPEPEYDR